MNRSIVGVIAATHLATFGIGYSLAPRELLDEEVKNSGYFTVDTTKILSATVASLREENKLLVYSYKPYTDVKRAWQEARAKAGLDDLHIHDLRHSAASFMINAGIDLYTVGKLLGHVSIASTTRYSHLANDTLMAAAEAGAAKLDVNWSKGGIN